MHTATDSCEVLAVLLAHRRRFVEVAQRILECRALAEDVVQDMALQLCESGPGRQPDNPRTHLARMVRHLAIDSVRRTSFECRLLAPIAMAEDTAGPCPCALERIEARETLCAVAAARDATPARTRRALLAHRLDATPQKAIAAKLGVSPTLGNVMIKDATIRCRRAMEDGVPPRPPGDAACHAVAP